MEAFASLLGWALFYLASLFAIWQLASQSVERRTFARHSQLKSRLAMEMDAASKLRGQCDLLRSRLTEAELRGASTARTLSEMVSRAFPREVEIILDGEPVPFPDTEFPATQRMPIGALQ